MPGLREIRIFVASPDDVQYERRRLDGIVGRLNSEFAASARFRAIRWEESFYKAHKTFQTQIPEPADCDLVIVIFGNKLGSALPDDFDRRLPDGSAYPSGTAYELLSSVAAATELNRPDVFVFRKTSLPQFGLDQKAAFDAAVREQERVDQFFQQWFRTPSGGFQRAFHAFNKPDAFEEKADALLRQWAGLSLQLAPDWLTERDGSPFRGLEPFDARHSRVFFGRGRKVQRAIDELIRASQRNGGRRFLLVVGPSGSGKSSLVRAGVIPRLTAPGVVPDVDLWRVAVLRPGGAQTPFTALAQAFYVAARPDGAVSSDGETDTGGFGAALPELKQGPYKTSALLAGVLEAALPSTAAPIVAALDLIGELEQRRGGFDRAVRADLLLLVDQLEEIFAGSVTDLQRVAFARVLTHLADSGRVWVIATLRADLYGRMLDSRSPFLALKDSGGSYDLASPGEAELTEILDKSAAAAGLNYERDPETGERLDERLLRDAAGPDTLPLLQFSLQELFKHRRIEQTPGGAKATLTFAAYKALGGDTDLSGLDGAINQVAEVAITDPHNGLTPPQIDLALPPLLRRLAIPVRDQSGATAEQEPLTVRAVPMAEATPDAASKTLIDILIDARLLVSASTGPGEASLRLAHERVLTSWLRAGRIVKAHRKYFRIEADVETELRRWNAGRQRNEFLLKGSSLSEAVGMVHDYGDEILPALRTYIDLSRRYNRRRQRLAVVAVSTAVLLVASVGAFALLAQNAQQHATSNYVAARSAADNLVATVAKGLRQQKNIPSETVGTMFQVATDLLDSIEYAYAQPTDFGFVAQRLQATYGGLRTLLLRSPPPIDPRDELEASRATLLYEFAKTYHQSAKDLEKARISATASLLIRQRLAASDATSPLRVGIAMDQMELGDIVRTPIDKQWPNVPNGVYAPARAFYEPAERTLADLAAQDPADIAVQQDYEEILTRLGDLDRKDRRLDDAIRRYTTVQVVTQHIFLARPDDIEPTRQLAWSYRKVGEVQMDRRSTDAALQAFTDELCIRRRLVGRAPGNGTIARDLGFGLLAMGDARMQGQDWEKALDAYDEAMYRRQELADSPGAQPAFFADFAKVLKSIAAVHRARGEGELADAFDGAAGDVTAKIPDVFPEEARLRGEKQPEMLVQQAKALLGAGVMATIEFPRRWHVEREEATFVKTRLEAVQDDPRACWDHVLRDIGAATAEAPPAR